MLNSYVPLVINGTRNVLKVIKVEGKSWICIIKQEFHEEIVLFFIIIYWTKIWVEFTSKMFQSISQQNNWTVLFLRCWTFGNFKQVSSLRYFQAIPLNQPVKIFDQAYNTYLLISLGNPWKTFELFGLFSKNIAWSSLGFGKPRVTHVNLNKKYFGEQRVRNAIRIEQFCWVCYELETNSF